MQEHYSGTTGYALLYLVLFFGVSLLTLLLSVLCSALGLEGAFKVAGGVIIAAFWICAFVVMQRFVFIENRRPTISEGNLVGLKSVLYVLVSIICVALIVATIGFVVSLFGGGDGAAETSKTARGANSEDRSEQAIRALMGVFTMMLFLYAAPFFNLAVISRFFTSKSEKD